MASRLLSLPRPPCAETLGFELLAEYPEESRIEIAFHPNASMLNPRGTVQGGFVAAMLDDAMGPALVSSSGDKEAPATIDMNVTFIAPVYPGRVIGKGRVVSKTRSTAFLEAELFDTDGNLLARATSTARIMAIGNGKT
ncbi:MAG: PaaI family thioesterase [Beijerinckiaceae bacterium]